MSKRILIVDDHPIICAAVKTILQEQGYHIVAECSNGFDALTKLRALEIDYMLLDISIDGIDGLSVLQRIVAEQIEVKTLIFTSHQVSTYAVRCMQAGALGFIGKGSDLSELIKGLNALADGYMYFPKEVISLYRDSEKNPNDPVRGLTNKEIIILQLLAQGFNNLTIAAKLNLSSKTISGHKINILRKLGVRTTIELASIAKELSLI